MNETSYSIQLGYMLDTDIPRYRELMACAPNVRDRLVDAGIERARRMSGHSEPRGSGTSAAWKPLRAHGCCAQAGAGKLFEHCKGAEHVAAEYGLSEAAAPSMDSLALLLGRARLAGALPQELNESGLRGAILGALNDSWRRLYREPTPRVGNDEERRLAAGLRSSADVFAERVARRGHQRSPAAVSSAVYQAPRMVPGV